MSQVEGEQPLEAEEEATEAPHPGVQRARLTGGRSVSVRPTPLRPPRPEWRSSPPPEGDATSGARTITHDEAADDEDPASALVPIQVMRMIAIGMEDTDEPEPPPLDRAANFAEPGPPSLDRAVSLDEPESDVVSELEIDDEAIISESEAVRREAPPLELRVPPDSQPPGSNGLRSEAPPYAPFVSAEDIEVVVSPAAPEVASPEAVDVAVSAEDLAPRDEVAPEEIAVEELPEGASGTPLESIPPEAIELETLEEAPLVTPALPPRPPSISVKSQAPSIRGMPQPPVSRRRPWWEKLFGEDFAGAYRSLPDLHLRKQVDFIEQALGLKSGAVVLDLCCGQGQHAAELALRGYQVVGYDLSMYQLQLAAERSETQQLKVNFVHGDMREMAFEQSFDAIVCWDTSFGYFEEEKNFSVAERMLSALRPGGVLLLDVLNRDFVAVDAPNHVWFEGDNCICMDDVSLDWITSRLKVKRSLILDDGRSREVAYSLRLYTLHELGKLLHDAGFRVTQASGDLTTPGVFFGPSSPRIIIRAQKPA